MTAVAACSPQVQPTVPVESALPSRNWTPEKPRAVIIALHGFNDYSHAFENSGKFFKAHHIAVVAYDQRGFGESPQTGIWAGEDNLVSDLADHVRQIKHHYPHTPVYILGESMGGAVAIVALANPDFPKVQGVILEAPAVWVLDPLLRAVLWSGAHTVPTKTVTGTQLKILASDNIPMLRALGRDPLVIKHTRIDAMYGLVNLMDDAYEKVPEVQTPVLLLYGAHDQVIPPEPIENSRTRFTAKLTYMYYPDGYHMLLRDLEGERVMGDMLAWIQNGG